MCKIYRIALVLTILSIIVYSLKVISPVFAASETFNISVSVTISPTTLVFQGYTSPGALVYIEENNSVVGTGISQSSGDFNVTLVGISSGISNYQIYSQDINGLNSNIVSISDNVMSDRINNVYNINLSPTMTAQSTNNNLSLYGMAYPLSKIEIFLNSNYEYSTLVNSVGSFEYVENASNIPLGQYEVTALDITSGGVISNYSNPITINITNTTSVNPNNQQPTNISPPPVTKTPSIHTVHVVQNSTLNYCSFNYCNGKVIPTTISKKAKSQTNTLPTFVISFSLLILIVIILRRIL